MITAIIIVSILAYIIIALRLQATQVLQPSFLESLGLSLWPIMFIVGISKAIAGRVSIWYMKRQEARQTRNKEARQ